MEHTEAGIVAHILELPIFQAEWVLWLLIVLSIASLAVMIERLLFYRSHRIDLDTLQRGFSEHLHEHRFAQAAELLGTKDSLETNVVLFGLREYQKGPEAVEDLIAGAMQKEKERYDRRLNFLATIASNAPYIGLFGTVLGIIRAFSDLSGNMADASDAVMAGISEALVATAVGLLVAIPAVVAFNVFKGMVKGATNNTHLLARILLAQLKSEG